MKLSAVSISLSRCILHGHPLRLELKVRCASLNPTIPNSILRVVKVTVEYLLC